uniref:Uncharacterized protein n=1 Tax=Trypanosoma congolense (strain IL3000) TaxID=1068625 RepID=G0UM89_TRYCI|nr:conserved hypothetical protein [Trypanosoma congolense IL3000]
MIKQRSFAECRHRNDACQPSSMVDIPTAPSMDSTFSSLGTSVNMFEEHCSIGVFELNIRTVCIDINRLINHMEVTGFRCPAYTYMSLLDTLEQLRLVVKWVRKRGSTTSLKHLRVVSRVRGIQTPLLPKELAT